MNHVIVHWHPVPVFGFNGNIVPSPLPEFIDHAYKGTLIATAFAMPRKSPIDFELAIKFASDIIRESDIGHESGQTFWYEKNFVQWISDLGYHIEFTGDEFEPLIPPIVES
jgi:hypothetical protein